MPPDALERWLTLLGLMAAALAGVLYLARATFRGFQLMERLADLMTHELTRNGGSSMKDDVAAIAVAVGQLQADVSDMARGRAVLQAQLLALAETVEAHHPAHRREEATQQ